MSAEPASPAPELHLAILAGGESKRIPGPHPKALHPVFFRPMIHYVLDAATSLEHRSLSLVVGRGEREFREQCRGFSGLEFFRQEMPFGEADAVRSLESFLTGRDGNVLILAADAVLLTASSLLELVAKHVGTGAAWTAGRAVSKGGKTVVHCFRIPFLLGVLERMGPGAAGSESSLGDEVSAHSPPGGPAAEYLFADPGEAMEVDDLHDLWRVETVLRERFNRELMLKGVSIEDPRTTLIDPRCRIDRDVRIESGCRVINSALAAGVVVESFCRIVDSEIGQGTRIRQGSYIEEARVGADCRVGPYARLRQGAHLADAVWIGNFVEIKNASLGAGVRAAHLSFIGDAQIGRNVNIGCGFITCNSSGRPLKQRTVIEDDVFIGSASQAIAPVTLGAGSFIATGTSVTDSVPPDSFVISRGRQVTKPGYAKKYGKPKDPSAPR